jgi:hypothetical protein
MSDTKTQKVLANKLSWFPSQKQNQLAEGSISRYWSANASNFPVNGANSSLWGSNETCSLFPSQVGKVAIGFSLELGPIWS